MRKPVLLILMLLATCSLRTWGEQIGAWKMYLSYYNATQNVAADHIIYSLMDGNLMSYDIEDSEVRTYDKINALSDVKISNIAYSQEAKRLLIVYENSNIDLMDNDGNVQNLSSLHDKMMSGKDITNVYMDGVMAYLTTGFGFIEVDMKEGVFRNSYRLGMEGVCIAVDNDYVYLGTASGLYKCSRQENMHQESNWQKLNTSTDWHRLLCFKDMLVGVRNNSVYVINKTNGSITTTLYSGSVSYLRDIKGTLYWGNSAVICSSEDGVNVKTITKDNTWNDISMAKNIYWVSDQMNGLRGYKITDDDVEVVEGPIQPNSPIRNLSYRISWVGNRLLVAGGVNTVGAEYYPPTAMYYEDGKWTNFEEMEIPEEYPKMSFVNTTNLVQDPSDPNHHFASVYRTGLCEYRDGKFVKLYNCDNSPLASILPYSSRKYNYVSCSGAKYDAEGNLWMMGSQTDTLIHVLCPNGEWVSLYYKVMESPSLCDDFLMHSSGLKLLNNRRLDTRGVFCFDTNGTLTDRLDDRDTLYSTIVNQDETSYTPDNFYGMCEDLDGRVWVGTSAGPFVIDDPQQMFEENFHFTQVKINRNDGSGLADYLLNGVSVNCIAVDGANRKWIGTHNDGVYLLSSDGTEMIHHFTSEDSPMPNGAINDIAVNHETGEVMIATEGGLCSYVSDATAAEETLEKSNVVAFPNPVSSDYHGPITLRGLTMNAEVKILSSSGQLVWSGVSSGGALTWNGCNKMGKRVASGVYHVVANDEAGSKAIVTRIVVIK